MFFTFLNKENVHCVDLAVMKKYAPEKVLFYYYNSGLTISIRTCAELIATAESEQASKTLMKWHQLLTQLEVLSDFSHFEQNEYLTNLGPYYHPHTNSRLYLTKDHIALSNNLNPEDMEILMGLHKTPEVNKELHAYYKNRRNSKKVSKNKEDLLKDVEMCIKSLNETEALNQHINYINKLLESRYALVEQTDLAPMEPDNVPVKPLSNIDNYVKPDNVIPFTKIKIKKKTEKNEGASFNHDTKVYFIRYREYEKACDRYKALLSEWPTLYQTFIDKCFRDIDMAEEKLKKANSALEIYNTIILKSYVQPNYQDVRILEKFKYYLETGRANDLQECMNLFEEERCWKDIKASQNRIENTIYFLQSETDLTRFADENLNQYLKQFNEAAASFEKGHN